jgi:hypothetical protein
MRMLLRSVFSCSLPVLSFLRIPSLISASPVETMSSLRAVTPPPSYSSQFSHDGTEIVLNPGAVPARPSIRSREVYLDVGSNSLSGTYALYDLLSIRSTSGSISINIELKEVDKENPKPAILVVHSQSGSVRIKFSALEIPEREYHTTVITNSGTIKGNLIHGKYTNIESQSASIDIDILPYSANEYDSTLHVKSHSGSQTVTILSPYFDPGTSMARMKSTHIVESGRLRARYPQEWEGRIAGQTTSGSLKLGGSDVEIIEKGSRGGGKYVVAQKGDGAGTLEFTSESGSADVSIGF